MDCFHKISYFYAKLVKDCIYCTEFKRLVYLVKHVCKLIANLSVISDYIPNISI